MNSIQTETVSYDTLFSTTSRVRRDRITDNTGNSQPTLDELLSAGKVEVENGGESIIETLEYAQQAMEWMSGSQAVSTEDVETITEAIYPWRWAVAPVRINLTDELRARANAMDAMDFAEAKIRAARQGLRTGVNTSLWGAQSGKSMLGFQDGIKDSPSAGSLGGIDQSISANSWFRNTAYTTSHTFTTKTVTDTYDGWVAIGTNYEAASDKNEEITHIAMGSTLYGKALSTLESGTYLRFNGGGRRALDAGGQGVDDGPMFRRAKLYKDRAVPASKIYGWNIDSVKLRIGKGANFSKTPFADTSATGVLGKVCFYIVMIQLTFKQPRRSFVETAVS